ncbi:hypothetical protein [Paenibacillus silvae]|uniref:hypothetical protein n=1 Tax=Paenibacillus silvae TaxID=1325358 RepID=UPI00142D5621|nr:hypothetical protein [Paenibacillus silvae]
MTELMKWIGRIEEVSGFAELMVDGLEELTVSGVRGLMVNGVRGSKGSSQDVVRRHD